MASLFWYCEKCDYADHRGEPPEVCPECLTAVIVEWDEGFDDCDDCDGNVE